MGLSVETCVAQHIGDRKEQQDCVALLAHPKRPGVLMAILADGMGGHTGGRLAAEQVLHTAQSNFEIFAPAEETPSQLMAGIINEAHTLIKLTRYINEKEPHSTACVLLFQPGRVDWAHCGDSRIYHFRGEQLVGRTTDHSFVEEMVRRGRITAAEALVHPQRNVLVSCLGSERAPNIDFGEAAALTVGDCFLLCSDGCWAYFSDQEAGKILAAHAPRQAAEVLIDRARDRSRGRGDNVSVAILKLVEKKTNERVSQRK